MTILIVAMLGVVVVILSILILKLHPLLGLLLGTLTVLLLTPQSSWLRSELSHQAIKILRVTEDGALELASPINELNEEFFVWPRSLAEPIACKLTDTSDSGDIDIGKDRPPRVRLQQSAQLPPLSEEGLPTCHAGDWLIKATDYQQSVHRWHQQRWSQVIKRLSSGLAATFEKIGVPILMAAIIGVCLLESGAAIVLLKQLHHLLGIQRTTPTLMVSGFVLGVPIFFDTVFYLLLPLARAFGRQRPNQRLLAYMAIIVGATMAHSLVPPTPGPLLVASQLGVPIGTMILAGCMVGGLASCSGFLYARWCNDRWNTAIADSFSGALNNMDSFRSQASFTDQSWEESLESKSSPPFLLASLPLILPVLLIAGVDIARAVGWLSGTEKEVANGLNSFLNLLAEPGMALMISAAISLWLLRRAVSASKAASLLNKAIMDAGIILLLTCSGGAFGSALQHLQLADAIVALTPSFSQSIGMLVATFLLTATIRIAQGSATVAMITAVGIVAPLTLQADLPFHPVYLALAIGCGAKLMPWMNDSGFWQVSTMTGMNTTQTLKTFSAVLTIMGCVGFAVTLIAAWLVPLR